MSKKTTIVPGVHDLIPPDGLITVELLHPDTGRVRQKVQAENSLMDWYRKNIVPNGGRGSGGQIFGVTTYDSFCPTQDLVGSPPVWEHVHQPNVWPSPVDPTAAATWLWATSSSGAPDQTKHHIPTLDVNGEVTSGVRLDATFAPDGLQLSRGTVTLASCVRSWARTRMVAEFGLSYGNGIYRSIGLGSLIPKRTGTGMRAMPPHTIGTTQWQNANSGISSNIANGFFVQTMTRGCVDFEDGGYWGASNVSTGLVRAVPTTTATPWPELVTLANLPGAGGQFSVAVNGSDFWIARNKVLYRCVKPVSNVAVTVTNTYDLSATVGADTILDIAVDRVGNRVFLLTQTRVHVINGATGGPVSSFLHLMTSDVLAGIEWSRVEDQLHVSFGGSSGGDQFYGTVFGSPSNYPSNPVVRGFTTAGAAAKSMWIPQYGSVSGNNTVYGAPYMALNDSGIALTHRIVSSIFTTLSGPTMATHALLGADVIKTGADALRITYDFDFA